MRGMDRLHERRLNMMCGMLQFRLPSRIVALSFNAYDSLAPCLSTAEVFQTFWHRLETPGGQKEYLVLSLHMLYQVRTYS